MNVGLSLVSASPRARRIHSPSPYSRAQKNKFARDLQDRLGILALLALSAPFRICKLQIPLAARATDPVSGHHIHYTPLMIPIDGLVLRPAA